MLQKFRNQVFFQDVLTSLKQLPHNSFDRVYGNPDYNVEINYNTIKYTKKSNEYIDWYIELTPENLRLFKPTANLFIINYPKQNDYLRVKYIEQNAYHLQHYVCVYNKNIKLSKRRFKTPHQSILNATKSNKNNSYKHNVALLYQNTTDKRIKKQIQKNKYKKYKKNYPLNYMSIKPNIKLIKIIKND